MLDRYGVFSTIFRMSENNGSTVVGHRDGSDDVVVGATDRPKKDVSRVAGPFVGNVCTSLSHMTLLLAVLTQEIQ